MTLFRKSLLSLLALLAFLPLFAETAKPKEPYTRNGSAMNDIDKIAKEEIEKNILPPLKATVPNLAQYDTVFVGCPVWRSTTPRVIDSFIAKRDFSGKTVIPFATYYLSGIDETLRHI